MVIIIDMKWLKCILQVFYFVDTLFCQWWSDREEISVLVRPMPGSRSLDWLVPTSFASRVVPPSYLVQPIWKVSNSYSRVQQSLPTSPLWTHQWGAPVLQVCVSYHCQLCDTVWKFGIRGVLEVIIWINYIANATDISDTFVNNQLDAQFFFIYVYFHSLHVSGSHVPTIRRIISVRHLVYVTP